LNTTTESPDATDEEIAANVQLVGAAPDLLEALKNLLILSECADETGYVEDVGFMDKDAIEKAAKDAISKAEGKPV
jgi:hypothetical protein